MQLNILRNIDIRLLRRYPHLWALQLPLYASLLFVLVVAALTVAFITQRPIDDKINVIGNIIIWMLLMAIPFALWVARVLRIGHPIQRTGQLKRAFAIYWITLATFCTLIPTLVYTHTLAWRTSLSLNYLIDASLEQERYIILFALSWISYVLYYLRNAPHLTFLGALASTIGIFLLSLALSTVEPWLWWTALVLSAVFIAFGTVILIFPQRFGNHPFVLESYICVLPTFGLSSGLARFVTEDFDLVSVFKQAAFVCGGVVLISPLFYVLVERLRARPA